MNSKRRFMFLDTRLRVHYAGRWKKVLKCCWHYRWLYWLGVCRSSLFSHYTDYVVPPSDSSDRLPGHVTARTGSCSVRRWREARERTSSGWEGPRWGRKRVGRDCTLGSSHSGTELQADQAQIKHKDSLCLSLSLFLYISLYLSHQW